MKERSILGVTTIRHNDAGGADVTCLPVIRLSVEEAAQMMGVHRSRVQQLIDEGVFQTQKDGDEPRAKRYILAKQVLSYCESNVGSDGSRGREAARKVRV